MGGYALRTIKGNGLSLTRIPRKSGMLKITYMTKLMQELDEILLYMKWGNISKDYFGFSRSWLYQRLNGYDGNGKECELTQEQRGILREALRDIAKKINDTADKL